MAIRFCDTAADFQTALNAANADDIIRLDHNVLFEGAFTVPDRGVIASGHEIVIESDTAAANLPATGYRTGPSYSGQMARVRTIHESAYQNVPAIQFLAGTNGWIVRNVEFMAAKHGSSMIIRIGNNYATYAQQPYNITFDRCLIRGDVIDGQRTGIYSEGKNIKVHNCYISDIKGYGQDAYCIGADNSQGPMEVINCYLSGAGYCFIVGGSDPLIQTTATVSGTPTSTTTVVNTAADLSIGQLIAIHYNDSGTGGTLRNAHVTVSNIAGGGPYTLTHEAMPAGQVAAVPGRVQWGCNFGALTFRRNHLKKDLAWESPILNTATLAVPTTQAGAIPAGTYYYRIQSYHLNGYQQLDYHSAVSNEQAVVLAGGSQVNLSWGAISYADGYVVYRYQKDGGGNRINGIYYTTLNTTYADTNDTGSATVSDFVNPTGSLWVVKNLWEIKMGIGWQVDSNIMEYCWTSPSTGGASVWLKSNNQMSSVPGQNYAQARDVVWEWNLIRHVNGFFDVSSPRSQDEQPASLPQRMKNWTIRNNLVYDSNDRWSYGGIQWAMRSIGGTHDLTVQHNTVIHLSHGAVGLDSVNTDSYGYMHNIKFLDNLLVHNYYGVFGPHGFGKTELEAVSNSAVGTTTNYDFNKNVLGGGEGSAAAYTITGKTNYTPDMTTFQNQFKSWGDGVTGNYRLKRIAEGDDIDSLYLNLGTDGEDIGCDVEQLMTKVTGVLEGYPEGSGLPVEPTVDPRVRKGKRRHRLR